MSDIATAYAKHCAKRRQRKLWRGGEVAPNRQDDDLEDEGVFEPLDSSGEPHTGDREEEMHPMEFMDDDDDEDAEEIPSPHPVRFTDALKRRPRRHSSY